MMPWDHAIVGYIAYSLFVHAVYRNSPTGRETIVVVFASLFPDLIDKPLAWQFGVFEGGYALAHSIFFAVPLSLAVAVLAYDRGRPRVGLAFGIGYLLHLSGDVVPSYVTDGELEIDNLLWPIGGGGSEQDSFFEGFITNFVPYARGIGGELLSGDPDSYVLFLLGIGGFGFLLWLYDGMPVVREGYTGIRNRVSYDREVRLK